MPPQLTEEMESEMESEKEMIDGLQQMLDGEAAGELRGENCSTPCGTHAGAAFEGLLEQEPGPGDHQVYERDISCTTDEQSAPNFTQNTVNPGDTIHFAPPKTRSNSSTSTLSIAISESDAYAMAKLSNKHAAADPGTSHPTRSRQKEMSASANNRTLPVVTSGEDSDFHNEEEEDDEIGTIDTSSRGASIQPGEYLNASRYSLRRPGQEFTPFTDDRKIRRKQLGRSSPKPAHSASIPATRSAPRSGRKRKASTVDSEDEIQTPFKVPRCTKSTSTAKSMPASESSSDRRRKSNHTSIKTEEVNTGTKVEITKEAKRENTTFHVTLDGDDEVEATVYWKSCLTARDFIENVLKVYDLADRSKVARVTVKFLWLPERKAVMVNEKVEDTWKYVEDEVIKAPCWGPDGDGSCKVDVNIVMKPEARQ